MSRKKGTTILAHASGDEDILSRVDVEDLLEYLEITIVEDQGDEILCWCPFHEMDGKPHKSPSFLINRDTTQWLCRSQCGGGNGINLVRKILGLKDGSAAWRWLNTFVSEREALEQEVRWVDESDYEVPLIEEFEFLEATKEERAQRKIYRELRRSFRMIGLITTQKILELEQRVCRRLLGDGLDLRVFYAIQDYRGMVPDADIRWVVNALPDCVWLYLDFQKTIETEMWEWWESTTQKMQHSLLRVKGGSKRHEESLRYGIQRSVHIVGQRVRKYKKRYKKKYLDMS